MQVATTIILLTSFLTGINPSVSEERIATCPKPNKVNESILEDFITKPYWLEERTETNTGHLTTSQISLLSDTNNSSICSSFNSTYQETLEEENSPGEKAYNVTYYKVGSFYFVVISIRQPANDTYIATGVNFIDVYDQNQDLIAGYAF